MIYKEYTVTVKGDVATINEPVYLYKYDKNVELRFNVGSVGYKYTKSDADNLVIQSGASFCQVRFMKKESNLRYTFDICPTVDGQAVLLIKGELIDENVELGIYDFQIRLLDENRESVASLPPIKGAIHIDSPLFDDEEAAADYSVTDLDAVAEAEPNLDTYKPDGTYNQTNWAKGDIISSTKLNKLEQVSKDNVDKLKEVGKPYDDTAIKADIQTLKTNEVNLIEDETSMDGIKDNEYPTLTTQDKTLIGGINEVNAQYKDIANNKADKNDLQVQKTRIDNLTTLTEGSTTGDAELIDGRTGADGVTYDNIGGAIRTQINDINSYFEIVHSKNLYDKNSSKNVLSYINWKGIIDSTDYMISHPIPVKAGVTYAYFMVPSTDTRIAICDKKGNYLSVFENTKIADSPLPYANYTPDVDGTVRINIGQKSQKYKDYFMFVEGNVLPDTYCDYVEHFLLRNNYNMEWCMDSINSKIYDNYNLFKGNISYSNKILTKTISNTLMNSASYNCSGVINVQKGHKYKWRVDGFLGTDSNIRACARCDENCKIIEILDCSVEKYNDDYFYTFESSFNGYIFISYPISYTDFYVYDLGSNATDKYNINTKLAETTTLLSNYATKYPQKEEELSQKINSIRDSNVVIFSVFTDVHGSNIELDYTPSTGATSLNNKGYKNYLKFAKIVRKISEINGVDFIANLGDTINSTTDEYTNDINKTENKKRFADFTRLVGDGYLPYVFATAHHELYPFNQTGAMTRSEVNAIACGKNRYFNFVTNDLDENKNYFYFDFKKIRFISLDSASNTRCGFNDEQVTWLKDVALNTNNKIIILSHISPRTDVSEDVAQNGEQVKNALNTFCTNGGTVLAWIHGHTHWDNIVTSDMSKDMFPYISVTSSLVQNTQLGDVSSLLGTPTKNKRMYDDYSEYAIDIFAVNYTTNKINIYRFGTGNDREI